MTINHQSIYDLIIESGYQNKNATHIFEIKHNNEKCRRYYHHTKSLFDKVTLLEVEALSYLKKQDRILDIGAGAGRISMYLQIKRHNVTALDKSKPICKVLTKRGIKKVINVDIFKYFPRRKYDVVLFVGVYSVFDKKKENITKFLDYVKGKILNKDGKLIFILADANLGKTEIVKRRFIFKNKIGPWFESIYPSAKDIIKLAKENNLSIEEFKKNNSGQYFLILKRSPKSC